MNIGRVVLALLCSLILTGVVAGTMAAFIIIVVSIGLIASYLVPVALGVFAVVSFRIGRRSFFWEAICMSVLSGASMGLAYQAPDAWPNITGYSQEIWFVAALGMAIALKNAFSGFYSDPKPMRHRRI